MAATAYKTTACRYCGSQKLVQFLSLGDQPPSNSFIKPDQISKEKRYPLDTYWCEQCCLVQLLDVVPAESIFNEYLYASSTSKALKNHYAQLAETLTKRFALKAGDVVVDIGCNDGILLNGYSLPGLQRVGVEPSQLAEEARKCGLNVVRSFFNKEAVDEIVRTYGHAKIVTATNVFAHVDRIDQFVANLPALLGDDGVFVIESPYLIDMIDQTLFDTIYHEHLCYLSLTPMVPFFEKLGLEIFDIERINFGASGPAIRVFSRKRQKSPKPMESIAKTLKFEKDWGIRSIHTYKDYAKKVEKVKTDVLALLKKLKGSGAKIGGYGAPAKGNTMLNYLGLTDKDLVSIAETNAMKSGCVTPGSHIPIETEDEFIKRMPTHALLLAWNYVDFFLQKSPYIQKGGKFIVPLPEPRIAP